MRFLLAVLALTGCLQQPGPPPSPEWPPPSPPPSSPTSTSTCGDGICWAGESCTSCELDCGACPPVCAAPIELGTAVPLDQTETLGAASTNTSCGATADAFRWAAPQAGVYHIASSAPVTSIQLGDCNGPSLACGGSDVPLEAGQHVLISLGGAATAQLTITRVPDACGDHVCEASEACDACAADCGACPYCGDGTCDAGEDSSTCPQDCTATTGGGGDGGPSCGDGICDATESCDTCSFDCGTCTIDSCGDGVCDASESWATCPGDCSAD